MPIAVADAVVAASAPAGPDPVPAGTDRGGFAPAARVARAVGGLIVALGSHRAGAAAAGVRAACARGVEATVEDTLHRFVRDAVPGAVDAGAPAAAGRARATAADAAGPRLPPAAWWGVEGGGAPDLEPCATEPVGAAIWPRFGPPPAPRRHRLPRRAQRPAEPWLLAFARAVLRAERLADRQEQP